MRSVLSSEYNKSFANFNCNKKIALFLPSLRGGGAERNMLYLANEFCDRSFQVDLVLVSAEGPYISLANDKVRIIDLKSPRVIASLPNLVRYLRAENPHALLSTLNHANLVLFIAKNLARNPGKIVVRIANNLSASTNNSKDIRVCLIPFLIKYIYHRVDRVIAVSQDLAEDLVNSHKLPQKKIKVIYNPAITPELVSKVKEPLNHPWFTPGSPPVILGAGRLTMQKDFSTLIRAFALLNQKFPARLMILGEGEDRKNLESLVRELDLEANVSLPGFVDNPFQYMNNASVFVLSSRWEGMPNTLLQAMACGVPVISTDCPSGPREILEDGKWGQIVPVGDAEALYQAILASLSGETRCPSREILERRFGIDNIIEQYLSVLI